MKLIASVLLMCLLGCSMQLSAQTTLFSQDFESGFANFSLNTTDMGGTATPNFWIVNNAYTGGSGSLVCFGFPFTYTIANTPQQTFHANLTSQYLHTMSIYGQADNIFCSSFAAADGICIFNSTNFAEMNTAINTTGYQNVSLRFWWNCAGGTSIYGELYYSVNGGTTWSLISTPISQYINQATWTQQTISLPAFDNIADLRFGFRFVNNQSSTALDPGFSIDDIVVLGNPMGAATVTTGTVSSLSVCPGDTIQVPYTISGSFGGGNVFSAELSDALGGFGSPAVIGSLSSASAGTITAIIPALTPTGTDYRIRVVASNPATTGSTNVSNITVGASPTIGSIASSASSVCAGTGVLLSLGAYMGGLDWESSPDGITWTSLGLSNDTINSGPLSGTTYFQAHSATVCGDAYSNTIQITVSPSNAGFAQGSLSSDSLCNGDSTTVTVQYHGSNIQWFSSTDGGGTWSSVVGGLNSYNTPGLSGTNSNSVMAVVDNGPCGIDSIVVPIVVEAPVSANFNSSFAGTVGTFTDASQNAVAWAWNFGDGNTSTQQNPVHIYAASGAYSVSLTVTSPFGCVAVFSTTVNVPVGVEDALPFSWVCYPIPFQDEVVMEIQIMEVGHLRLQVLDLQGRRVALLHDNEISQGKQAWTWRPQAAQASGAYWLQLELGGRRLQKQVILQR